MFDLFDDIPKPDIDWQPDWLARRHRIRPDGGADRRSPLAAGHDDDARRPRAAAAPDRVAGRAGRRLRLFGHSQRAAAVDARRRANCASAPRTASQARFNSVLLNRYRSGPGQHGLARRQGTRTRAGAGDRIGESRHDAHLRIPPRAHARDAHAAAHARQPARDARTHAAGMGASRAEGAGRARRAHQSHLPLGRCVAAPRRSRVAPDVTAVWRRNRSRRAHRAPVPSRRCTCAPAAASAESTTCRRRSSRRSRA